MTLAIFLDLGNSPLIELPTQNREEPFKHFNPMKKLNPSTLSVHAGSDHDYKPYPGVTPIYQSSTFKLTDAVYSAMTGGRPRDELIYSRYDNPTIRAVEKKLSALEGSRDSLVFSSGMGAISTVLSTFLKPGDRLVCAQDLYGGTQSFFNHRLTELGITVEYVPTTDIAAWEKALSLPAQVVYCESLTNPLVKVTDLDFIAGLAHTAGAISIVDNTFATPINLRPIEHGFDIVIHSGSKYLGGHSDLICGTASGSVELMHKIWNTRTTLGTNLDPHAAFLLERGMKTLAIRVERQNDNARKIAEVLHSDNRITWVSYPCLLNHPQFELAQKLFPNGTGGVIAFSVGDEQAAVRLMRSLQVIKEATSLGGVESVISMPSTTSHSYISEAERQKIGITPGTLRLSCGIEDRVDLIDDLKHALDQL